MPTRPYGATVEKCPGKRIGSLPWITPNREQIENVARRVAGPSDLKVAFEKDDLLLSFPVARVAEVVSKIDPVHTFSSGDYLAQLDPPRPDFAASRSPSGSLVEIARHEYTVLISFVDWDEGTPARMILYSNNSDNRACWPVAYIIAAVIAEGLGAIHEDAIERDPEEAMGWSSDAILMKD